MKETTALGAGVPFNPGIFAGVETGQAVSDDFQGLRFLTHTDNIAGHHLIRGDIDNLSVDDDMLVKDKLTGSGTARSETETIDDIVQTALQQLEKNFTGDTLRTGSTVEEVAELTLQNAVGVFSFLLLLELNAILRNFAATVVAMLARRIILLGKNFIFAEDGFPELAGDFCFGACVSCLCLLLDFWSSLPPRSLAQPRPSREKLLN